MSRFAIEFQRLDVGHNVLDFLRVRTLREDDHGEEGEEAEKDEQVRLNADIK